MKNCNKLHQSLISIIIICVIVGCNEIKSDKNHFKTFDPKFEPQVDSILRVLTLEEKIALLHGNSFFSSAGIERLGITEMKYTDGPLGIREEINRNNWNPADWTNDSALFFPAGSALAATWNRELARKYGEVIGQEARARDKDILLAPAINIMRTPLCGRNYEYFSEDPFLNAQLAALMVKGIQMQDVGACVKHYAFNNQEKNREYANILASERAIREIYLSGFKATVDAGAYCMMGAYNKFRGYRLCENNYLLNQILKDEWGFKGFVLSDWSAVKNMVNSALYGLDVEMGSGSDYDNFHFADSLKKAVEKGLVPEEVINDKARRIIRIMLNLKKNDTTRLKGSINTPEHSSLIYDVASEAIVLLKNEGNILPLDKEKIKSIAVIGDNATRKHGAGVFGAGVKVKYEITPLEGLENRLGDNIDIKFAKGYKEQYYIDEKLYWKHLMDIDHTPDKTLIAEAVSIAKNSDIVILVLGSTRDVESEGADRKDIRLPFGQDSLIRAVTSVNKNTIAVFVGGGPFDLNVTKEVSPAIVWAWFNGSEAGNALADVLFGKINPSGKLPFTFPYKLEDSPAHALNTYPGGDTVIYSEDILVGYRWFDTKKIEPMYCFGYGMSYTNFEYSNIKVDKKEFVVGETINISLNIKNIGEYDGKEITQVYVRKKESSVERADKELKGFSKVSLQKGKSKNITISINTSDLAYYNEKTMNWKVEPGKYEILVGASSKDIKGSVVINVKNK